jgi:site-specific DNA-methyltransferase (adenine-specific)
MKPYYEASGITIYHGDCREIMPGIKADAVVTDPPYGIRADERQTNRSGKRGGKAVCESKDYGRSEWDKMPPSAETIQAILACADACILWGGNYFEGLPTSRAWLVWDKMTGNNGYADAELAWTNLDQAVRMIHHRWMGMLRDDTGDDDTRHHPTQKPVRVMRWCIGFTGGDLILDPFMGSGTTLRAAKDLGRRAIGIEIEERYCEIAAKRMAQEVLL